MSKKVATQKDLVDVTMGRKPADLVLRHGNWVCVQSGEILPDTDLAIIKGRIAYVGADASHTVGQETQVIDIKGKYLVPGLLDAHMHVESGMLTVTEFVRAVLPHGTTGMFIDPHEIANVFGLKGVKLMVDEAARQPIHVWVQVPSCVPSAPGLETSGGVITPEDVSQALEWDGIIGLGEVMNYPGVTMADKKMLAEIDAARRSAKVVGGHYASPDLGRSFHAYAAGGAEDDHEGTRLEDAVARVRQGMKSILRYGSAWQDVAAQVKAITELHMEPRHFLLCTDDVQAETILHEGHMDRVVRHAVAQGLEPMTAIQMATINTAEHFGVSRQVGMIAPGRWADVLIMKDLREFHPDMIIARGEIVVASGKIKIALPKATYPAWATRSMHLKRHLTAADFKLTVQKSSGKATAHVIGVIENQAPTRHLVMDVDLRDGEVKPDIQRDIAKIAVVERHHAAGKVQVGLVNGFGLTACCAIASTVAHDCHQMIVVGTDEENMALAANALADAGGGQVVVKDGKVIALIELALGGLMSMEHADVVARKAGAVIKGFRTCGCILNDPNMTLSLLALVVIPELRLSDRGLVDVNKFAFIPVVEIGA